MSKLTEQMRTCIPQHKAYALLDKGATEIEKLRELLSMISVSPARGVDWAEKIGEALQEEP